MVHIRKRICKCKYSGMTLVYLLRNKNKGEIFIGCKIALYSHGEIRNIYLDIWYCSGHALVTRLAVHV